MLLQTDLILENAYVYIVLEILVRLIEDNVICMLFFSYLAQLAKEVTKSVANAL